MRLAPFLAIALSLALSASLALAAAPSFCDEDPVMGYYPAWSDDFDGNKLNPTYWSATDGTGQYAWACGRKAACIPDNVLVKDGAVHLVARAETHGNSSYTSGGITTEGKYEFTRLRPFRACVRAKLPGGAARKTPGAAQGFFPAVWFTPVTGCTPDTGEIDLLEMVNGDGTVHGTYHWKKTPGTPLCMVADDLASKSSNAKVEDFDEFHEYAVEVTDTYIRFIHDLRTIGYVMRTDKVKPRFFDEPSFLNINFAIGGGWPGPPAETTDFSEPNAVFAVDYVRIAHRNH